MKTAPALPPAWLAAAAVVAAAAAAAAAAALVSAVGAVPALPSAVLLAGTLLSRSVWRWCRGGSHCTELPALRGCRSLRGMGHKLRPPRPSRPPAQTLQRRRVVKVAPWAGCTWRVLAEQDSSRWWHVGQGGAMPPPPCVPTWCARRGAVCARPGQAGLHLQPRVATPDQPVAQATAVRGARQHEPRAAKGAVTQLALGFAAAWSRVTPKGGTDKVAKTGGAAQRRDVCSKHRPPPHAWPDRELEAAVPGQDYAQAAPVHGERT